MDFGTVDGVSSIWNDAERKMMALQGWDKDPLTPFLECLLEITPKAPSSISADYYFKDPACSGKFKQTHRLGLLEKFQDFAVEIRGDPPPAPPLKRLRLYLKNGQPNIEAVSHFINTCPDGTLLPMYISLVNLGDTNSWGEGPYIADENSIEYSRMKVQNYVSLLKHVHHLDLDRDWAHRR